MPSTLSADPAAALTQLDRFTVTEILALWKLLVPSKLQQSFVSLVLPGALAALVTAQEAAATVGANSVDTAVQLDPAAFAGLGADGYELPTKLAQPLVGVYKLLAGGMRPWQALAVGAERMDQVVTTEIHDVSRSAEQVVITADRTYTGWIREIEAGACSRCILLAGRVYRWSEGFKRHPQCRCHHTATDLPVNQPSDAPKEYFDSLSQAEQDRTFTPDTAEAIRLGGDMNQLVNARQGISEVGGQKVTTQGTTKRSWYAYQQRAITQAESGQPATLTKSGRTQLTAVSRSRLLPEEIFKQAGTDRARALTMLTENGYIVGDLAANARRVVASRAVPLT